MAIGVNRQGAIFCSKKKKGQAGAFMEVQGQGGKLRKKPGKVNSDPVLDGGVSSSSNAD